MLMGSSYKRNTRAALVWKRMPPISPAQKPRDTYINITNGSSYKRKYPRGVGVEYHGLLPLAERGALDPFDRFLGRLERPIGSEQHALDAELLDRHHQL